MRGSKPPRCHAHQENDNIPGRATIPPGADIFIPPGRDAASTGREPSAGLQTEIALVRKILSLLDHKAQDNAELSDEQLIVFARLVFDGARTLSRLLRDQFAISGDTAEGMKVILDLALKELGAEWDLEL